MRRLMVGGSSHGRMFETKGDSPWHLQMPERESTFPDADPWETSYRLITYELRKILGVCEHPGVRNTVRIYVWQVYVHGDVPAHHAVRWAQTRGFLPDHSELAVADPLDEWPPTWIYDDPGTAWFVDSGSGEFGGRMPGQTEE